MTVALPVAFAQLMAGGLLLATAATDPAGDPLRVIAGADHGIAGFAAASSSSPTSSTSSPAGSPAVTGPQKQQVSTAAKFYGLSPRTLWGVFGTETSFGSDTSTSSAGAEGPFQFLPSTWAKYGAGGNIRSFSDALLGAARYLHSLGANSDPNSPATIAALNAYNGNGGGSSVTGYVTNVHAYGGQF